MAELKPCPFACKGKTARVYDFQNCSLYDFQDYHTLSWRWRVKCDKCGAEGPIADSKEEAIDAWNKRN